MIMTKFFARKSIKLTRSVGTITVDTKKCVGNFILNLEILIIIIDD
jgi:hypothetical protein